MVLPVRFWTSVRVLPVKLAPIVTVTWAWAGAAVSPAARAANAVGSKRGRIGLVLGTGEGDTPPPFPDRGHGWLDGAEGRSGRRGGRVRLVSSGPPRSPAREKWRTPGDRAGARAPTESVPILLIFVRPHVPRSKVGCPVRLDRIRPWQPTPPRPAAPEARPAAASWPRPRPYSRS